MIRPRSILLLILVSMLALSPALEAKGPAPEGRTYFIVVMGLDDPAFAPAADCLSFEETRACVLDSDVCLDWQRVEGGVQSQQQSGFSLTAEIDDEGLIIAIDGQGRVDARGNKSSISAVARASALDLQMNFALAGRQISRNKCRRMVESFAAELGVP